MVKALPNTSFLPVPKSAPAGHTTAAAHLLWQVFPRYPCLEYKDNSGQSCPVRYTWTASFGCGLMFWQKWFNLTPQFVAYQFPGHLLHPHWYFTAYSSICQVLLGALSDAHNIRIPNLRFIVLGEMVHFAPYYILHNKQRRTSWQLVRLSLFSFQLPDDLLYKPPAQPAGMIKTTCTQLPCT